MSKDHFYFSRNDRIVALILLSVIILSKGAVVLWPSKGTVIDPEVDSMLVARSTEQPRKESNSREYNRRDTAAYTPTYNRTVRRTLHDTVASSTDTAQSLPRYRRKEAPLSQIDLNAADSLMLVSLPGIGPYYARRIIRYRQQLGGYARTAQLLEIDGLSDSVMKWFIITDTVPLNPVRVNSLSLTELRNHPYLNFYQARAILDFRRERGMIKGPEQLSFMEEFTAQDLERLEPYLDFR